MWFGTKSGISIYNSKVEVINDKYEKIRSNYDIKADSEESILKKYDYHEKSFETFNAQQKEISVIYQQHGHDPKLKDMPTDLLSYSENIKQFNNKT